MTARSSRTVACVTCTRLPGLCEDDQPLLSALRSRGIEPVPVAWDDPTVDWSAFPLVVVVSPWDYPDRSAEFLAWYERVASVTTIANSLDAVRANHHKRYLADLAAAGAPVIPTEIVDDPGHARAVARRHGWADAVVKPATALGGRGVTLLSAVSATSFGDAPGSGEWCLQPFLSNVRGEGEISVVHIDGRLSHALVKRPPAGEIRVHEGYGGTHEPYPVTAELAEAADAVMDAAGCRDELYARVDLIRADDGRLQLVELDVTSPCLFFCHRPEAAAAFAEAVELRLVRQPA
ncbi:RimK family alpha-L-glutamate ligase [Streptomyces sp. NPDC053069]|uniref:RimK family alpha-L-glutamate ligase n=1 Tax=Streptomyces sp. NPDC053069 TaxID=3365695 RepID=UPI0037CFE700